MTTTKKFSQHQRFEPRNQRNHEKANAGQDVADTCKNCNSDFSAHNNGRCPIDSISPLSKPKLLDCCCCGGGTYGRQWHGRDTGYGCCDGCIADEVKRGTPAETMRECYGIKGIHYNVTE